MPPEEGLPRDIGPVFEDCFEVYVAGECLTTKEAFLRHPMQMSTRFARETWPILLPVLVGVAALVYRHWIRKRLKTPQTHDVATS